MTRYRYVSDLFGREPVCFDSVEEAEKAFSELAGVPVRLTEGGAGTWAIRWHHGFYVGLARPVYDFELEFDKESWGNDPNWEVILEEIP